MIRILIGLIVGALGASAWFLLQPLLSPPPASVHISPEAKQAMVDMREQMRPLMKDMIAGDAKERRAILDEHFFAPRIAVARKEYPVEEEVLPIDEWKTYYVKIYGEKDILFLDSGKSFVKPLHGRVFEINFKNFVGLTRIGNVNLQVKNKKISDALYDSMLGFITEKYADLIFSFNTPVGLEYEKDSPGRDILYLQYQAMDATRRHLWEPVHQGNIGLMIQRQLQPPHTLPEHIIPEHPETNFLIKLQGAILITYRDTDKL